LAHGPISRRKVALGTAVLLPGLRNPVVLAHQLATLDQIWEGRLVLGAGIASEVPNIRAEFAAAGASVINAADRAWSRADFEKEYAPALLPGSALMVQRSARGAALATTPIVR
jgi:alkanesulfonate monooxygenase SsuD/methylene tetrahydromethanopterin reductase-like flavin-dependent oxidoreductase (luciferase family)